MDKVKIVEELYKAVELYGLPETISKVFGKNVNVRVGFTRIDCDKKVEEIDFSVRAINSLRRAGLNTISDVIDAVSNDALMKIKNLGIKTRNEIKTQLFVLGYCNSTPSEKRQILTDILNRNTIWEFLK